MEAGRIRQFISGFFYPFRGLKMVFTHLRLMKYALAPILINIIIFMTLLFAAKHYWMQFISRLEPNDAPIYMMILMWIAYYLAMVLGFVLFCLICFLLFTTIGNVIAAPFLDMLSECTECVYWQQEIETPFSLKLLFRDLGVLLLEESRKLLTWLLFMLAISPLLLIPILGYIMFLILSTVFSVYFLGLAFVDFSLARRRHGLAKKKAFAWRVKYTLLGLGTAISIRLLNTLIAFLCLPISTVGATLLFCEHSTPDEQKFQRPDLKPQGKLPETTKEREEKDDIESQSKS